MLLAIVMVLSMAPVSVLASAANPSYTYVDPVISSSQFTVDTSATTEVIRVAAAVGSFSVSDGTANAPNTIVAATPSGIPENPGTYNYIGYAGETPVQPQVSFSITGKTLDSAPSVVANADGITFGGATKTENGSTTTYTIPVQGSSATSLNANSDIIFTITYKISGTSYTAYAYSHVENILVMNGFSNVVYVDNSSDGTARMSVIGQYQSKNMYSLMNTDGGTASKHAYVNYASEGPLNGGSLMGAGCEDDPSGEINAYVSAAPNSSIAGNEVQAFTKDYKEKDGEVNNHCQGEDQYRSEPVVYMDYGETLQSLNFRFTAQPGEKADNQGFTLAGFNIYSPGDDPHPDDTTASLAASTAPASEITASTLAAGNTSSATIDVGSSGQDAVFGKYIMAKFSGIGSTGDTSSSPDQQHVIYAKFTTSYDGRNLTSNTAIGVVFKHYDTRDLKALYDGILRGDGSAFTPVTSAMSGKSLSFNKGPNPRASMYKIVGTQWTDFISALNEAGRVLAKPNTNQTEIDTAATNLYNTYNALSGYNSTVTYNIKHVLTGTSTEIIPMQEGTASAGSTMVSKAATITGYKVVETSSYTTDISGGEALVTVTYYYEPENFNLNIYSNNPDVPPKMLSQPYGTEIKVADLETGTREYYLFDGWFYDNTKWQQPVSDFSVTEDTSLYGKWSIAPLYVNIIPKTNKNVILENNKTSHLIQLLDEETPETFDQPADYSVDGYIFGGYYDDAEFQVPAVWPKEFNFGDSSIDVYARMIDVNGVISFNSNGGSTVPDSTYEGASASTPVDVPAPDAPTRPGYDFVGWYDETGTTQYFVNQDGSQTMTSQTGFVAYAKWEAQEHRITFDMGEPTSKFDTKTSQMPIIVGLTDDPIPADQIPPTPIRYGKTFAQWTYEDDGQTVVYKFDKIPPKDIVLEPVWNDSNFSAFVSLDAYEKLSGEYKELETDENGKKLAQAGDIVTFRMTSQTNFNVGSTVFAFMYDKNFYELVDSGSDAFTLNRENEYIAGINAQHIGITSDTAMDSFWPESLENIRTTYNAMMVTIDPTVTSTDYYCKPMSDGTWLVEFRLRVKDNATGDGTVYMSNEWTRTADNIMGTMFYGWAAPNVETSVADTNNSTVEPNLDLATQTLTIDSTVPETAAITVDANGGSWADGDTVKSFDGRAETEIIGYTSPIREGYKLDAAGWAKDNGDGTLDASVTWAEGYYGKVEQNGFTFKAQWIADEFTINYYTDETATELWETEQLAYDSVIDGPFYPVEKTGYVLDKWVDADGNEYIIGETTVPLGGVDLYAVWAPATDTPYTVTINYFDNNTQTDKTTVKNMTGTTDTTVKIVSEVPATPEAGVSYVLISDLPTVMGYEFDVDNPDNADISCVITADGKGNINVYYKAKIITYTYKANGGVFSNGTDTMTYSGEFQTAVPTIEQPTKVGNTFSSWTPASRPKFTVDTTFTANWTVAKYDAVFNAGEGAFADASTTKTVQVAYGSAITAPASPSKTGYDFIGWSVNGTDVVTDLGTMTEAGATFTALFKVASYDVSYTVDDEAFGTSTKVDYNGTVTVDAYPADTKLGHYFDGWYYDGDKYAPGDTLSMPATAVTFTGYYLPGEYDAVFDANGGYFDNDTAVTSKNVPTVFGDNIVAPAQPQKAGHSFLGWTDTKGSQSVVTVGAMNTEGKTYYAVWKAEIWNYNIELYYMDTNGQYPATPAEGDTSTSQGNVGTTVTYTPVEKTGFAVDTQASTLSGTVTVDPELTIKVYYARNKYTVYTNVNGTRAEAGEFYYDAPVSIPDATPEAGYTFVNWTPAVTSPMPAADQEVTAVFDEIPYTVTFYKDATKAEVAYTNELDFGTSLAGLVLNPTMEGYTFKGWAYEGTTDVLNLANETVPVDGVTLVGIWEIESYTVNFRANGGTYVDGTNNKQISIQYGATVNVPEVPTRVGYAFNGWNPSIPATMPDVDTGVQNYMAQWTQEKYTVNFVIDGVTTSEEYVLNDEVIVPGEDQTVKTGYTFLYWTDENGNEVEPITTMTDLGVSGTAITYTAKFEINKHLATFVSEGTTVESKEYEYEAAVAKPANDPTKTGYTFVAWVDGNGTEYGADEALPAMGDAPVTYTAKFTINSYKATFVSEGETVEEKDYEYEAAVAKPATDPAKTGWTFVAWVGEDGTEYDKDTALPAMGDADVTYTAKFTINSYTVTFISEGETVESKNYEYEAAVAKPATNPTKTGWTFVAWVADGVEYDENTALPAMGDADVTYTAKFVIDSHKVTWISNGVTVETKDYNYGEAVAKPANPVFEGHTFAGWVDNNGVLYGTGIDVPAMGTEDVTYTAKWDIDSHVVTWISEGEKIHEESFEYGSAVTKPEDPAKTGYTFVAWEAADGTRYDKNTAVPAMGTADVTYIAVFEINTYTVTFLETGDTVITPITQQYNSIVVKPGDPSQKGYTFKGWATKADATEADVVTLPATWNMPAEDVNYYAVWTINQYKVTFLNADGSVYSEELVDYNSRVEAPAGEPTLEFYTFEGWSLTAVPEKLDKETAATYVTDLATTEVLVPVNGITIYPAFARIPVTLKLIAESTAKVENVDTAADPTVGYITGLTTRLNEAKLLSNYLTVEGDGELKVTPTKYNRCGTGTKVEVIDRVTNETVEIYYLVIFGDVNGDSAIDATDAAMIRTESIGLTSWSNTYDNGPDGQYSYAMTRAADVVNEDEIFGIIQDTDAVAIDEVVLMYADIDQTTGKVVY